MELAHYEAMSFDCYGTLVDWERGILDRLRPWAGGKGLSVGDGRLIELFGRFERAVEAEAPGLLYPAVLAEVLRRVAAELGVEASEGEAAAFGASVGDWPVFAETTAALRRLAARHRLFVLSNVDRASFARSQARIGVDFEAALLAEDLGCYKPDPRSFAALEAHVGSRGIPRARLLHVGESLYHDVVPGRAAGLDVAWADRRAGRPDAPRASGALETGAAPTYVFPSLAALADACEGAERNLQ